MGGTGRVSRHAGAAVVLLVGGATFLLQAVHALGEGENALTFLFGILIPMLLSLVLVGGAVWLGRSDATAEGRLRVAAWCVAGAVLMALAGVLVILYQFYEGVVLSDQFFVVANIANIGALAGFVVGVYDAQRRTAAERLERERARVERLNQRLSVVNRVLRHDVRNSVNVIHGYADMLVERSADDAAKVIRDRILHLYELTETARAVERTLEDGRTATEVDVVPLVESAAEAARANHPEATVTVDLPGSASVYGTPQLESAFRNVVENAIEHNDTGAPRVEVSLEQDATEDPATVAIEVADDGPGIPPGQRSVFERGWESPMEHSPGTGLWLSNWIVEDAGGEMTLEANEPRGTTVVIRLRGVDGDGLGS